MDDGVMEKKYPTEPLKIVPNSIRENEIKALEKCLKLEQMNYHQAGVLNPIFIPLKNTRSSISSNDLTGSQEEKIQTGSSKNESYISQNKFESGKPCPNSELRNSNKQDTSLNSHQRQSRLKSDDFSQSFPAFDNPERQSVNQPYNVTSKFLKDVNFRHCLSQCLLGQAPYSLRYLNSCSEENISIDPTWNDLSKNVMDSFEQQIEEIRQSLQQEFSIGALKSIEDKSIELVKKADKEYRKEFAEHVKQFDLTPASIIFRFQCHTIITDIINSSKSSLINLVSEKSSLSRMTIWKIISGVLNMACMGCTIKTTRVSHNVTNVLAWTEIAFKNPIIPYVIESDGGWEKFIEESFQFSPVDLFKENQNVILGATIAAAGVSLIALSKY